MEKIFLRLEVLTRSFGQNSCSLRPTRPSAAGAEAMRGCVRNFLSSDSKMYIFPQTPFYFYVSVCSLAIFHTSARQAQIRLASIQLLVNPPVFRYILFISFNAFASRYKLTERWTDGQMQTEFRAAL